MNLNIYHVDLDIPIIIFLYLWANHPNVMNRMMNFSLILIKTIKMIYVINLIKVTIMINMFKIMKINQVPSSSAKRNQEKATG